MTSTPLEPREYSKRLGVLTPQQLQAALGHFGHGTLLAAEAAPAGLFGQNVLLETTDGRFVLRGCPHFPWQFAKERYFARIIHERTDIPAPWPYEIDDSSDIFGWPYAIMPRLEGTHISDDARGAMDADGLRALARAMGEGLARLAAATWPVHAWWSETSGELEPLEEPYADWYIGWTRYWLEQCRAASDETTDGDVAWCESVMADARDALAVPFTPSLVHTDYQDQNIVLEDAGDGALRVSGIFDIADMYMGDTESDLPRPFVAFHMHHAPAAAGEVVRAYHALRQPRPGFAARWRLYTLRDRLVFWEYGQRNKVWFRPGVTLRQWAERWVELPPGL